MWYFTADQHFDHYTDVDHNIMKYCNRPWKDINDHNEALIEEHNRTVRGGDVVVIAGDITLYHNTEIVMQKFLSRLNGNKILLKGNHDHWFKKDKRYIYHKKIEDQFIAVCHYPMRTWKNCQYESWNLHGHSHGNLFPLPNQLDIGVDNAYRLLGSYRPFSFEEVKDIINVMYTTALKSPSAPLCNVQNKGEKS